MCTVDIVVFDQLNSKYQSLQTCISQNQIPTYFKVPAKQVTLR